MEWSFRLGVDERRKGKKRPRMEKGRRLGVAGSALVWAGCLGGASAPSTVLGLGHTRMDRKCQGGGRHQTALFCSISPLSLYLRT